MRQKQSLITFSKDILVEQQLFSCLQGSIRCKIEKGGFNLLRCLVPRCAPEHYGNLAALAGSYRQRDWGSFSMFLKQQDQKSLGKAAFSSPNSGKYLAGIFFFQQQKNQLREAVVVCSYYISLTYSSSLKQRMSTALLDK